MVSGAWLLNFNIVPFLAAPSVGKLLAVDYICAYALTDLAPATSSCSPGQKSPWKGKRFQVITELQLHVTLQLQAVPKQTYYVH